MVTQNIVSMAKRTAPVNIYPAVYGASMSTVWKLGRDGVKVGREKILIAFLSVKLEQPL